MHQEALTTLQVLTPLIIQLDAVIIPTLKMRKLRPPKAKLPAQGHVANTWGSQDSNPDSLASEYIVLSL